MSDPKLPSTDIWFIDDETELGETYSAELATSFPTQYFTSADQAFNTFNKNTENAPSVIITDLSMPGMNGLDLIRNLRAQNYQGEFILVSGYAGRPHLAEAFSHNVFSFIDKPFDFDQLKKILIKCLEKSTLQLQNKIFDLQTQLSYMHELLEVYHQRLSQAENTLNKIDSQPFSNKEEKVKYLELMSRERMLLKKIDISKNQLTRIINNQEFKSGTQIKIRQEN